MFKITDMSPYLVKKINGQEIRQDPGFYTAQSLALPPHDYVLVTDRYNETRLTRLLSEVAPAIKGVASFSFPLPDEDRPLPPEWCLVNKDTFQIYPYRVELEPPPNYAKIQTIPNQDEFQKNWPGVIANGPNPQQNSLSIPTDPQQNSLSIPTDPQQNSLSIPTYPQQNSLSIPTYPQQNSLSIPTYPQQIVTPSTNTQNIPIPQIAPILTANTPSNISNPAAPIEAESASSSAYSSKPQSTSPSLQPNAARLTENANIQTNMTKTCDQFLHTLDVIPRAIARFVKVFKITPRLYQWAVRMIIRIYKTRMLLSAPKMPVLAVRLSLRLTESAINRRRNNSKTKLYVKLIRGCLLRMKCMLTDRLNLPVKPGNNECAVQPTTPLLSPSVPNTPSFTNLNSVSLTNEPIYHEPTTGLAAEYYQRSPNDAPNSTIQCQNWETNSTMNRALESTGKRVTTFFVVLIWVMKSSFCFSSKLFQCFNEH
jgi:hypothetical protein